MRRNAFGDAYCHTPTEVFDEMNEKDVNTTDIHLAMIDAPEDGETMWSGDVADNETGDTVLYIEADSAAAVRSIAKECGIEDTSIPVDDPPFSAMPYGRFDKDINVIGPNGFRFSIDFDDVDPEEIQKATEKLLRILNKYWGTEE